MSRKSLILLAVCLVIGAGIALYAWAGCCGDDSALCNGGAWKVGGSDCYYDFEVDLTSDCVGTTTVRLALTEIGGGTYWYLCQPTMDPPYPDCVPMGVRVPLDPDKDYGYHFVATGGCTDREPPVGDVLLDPDCD